MFDAYLIVIVMLSQMFIWYFINDLFASFIQIFMLLTLL